jgi:tetratricopeptide (TPR) repeat protein
MNRRPKTLVLLVAMIALTVGCDGLSIRKATNEGHRLFNQQKYLESITAYEKILKIDPKNWLAHYQIALAYTALYHPGSTHPMDKEYAEKATAGFEAMLQMTPPKPQDMEKVREYYVALLSSSEQYDKAIEYYEALLKAQPNDIKVLEMLAVLYYDKRKVFTPAMQAYQKLAELDPQNPVRWYTIGQRYWNRSYSGNKEGTISIEERQLVITKGMEALDKALKLDPEYMEAIAYYNLLWRERSQVLQMLGDNVGANEAFDKAKELQKRAIEIRDKKKSQKPA